jgi:hypothetical protein
MDLRNDSLGVEDIQAVTKTVGNVATAIRNKAKAKKAQAQADAGNYFTLRPFLKGLIPIPNYVLQMTAGTGITEAAIKDLPEQSVSASRESIMNALRLGSGLPAVSPAVTVAEDVTATPEKAAAEKITVPADKKKLLYIVGGVAVVGVIIYLVSKS